MKTAYQIAKEIGVSYQAVYKRITPAFVEQVGAHAVKVGKGYRFDLDGELAIKSLFGIIEQEHEPSASEPAPDFVKVYKFVDNRLINELHTEIKYLSETLRKKEKELLAEREQFNTFLTAFMNMINSGKCPFCRD